MTEPATTGPAEDDAGGDRALDFHVELYWSVRDREPIAVRCWCPIGRTHGYEEWVERFGERAAE